MKVFAGSSNLPLAKKIAKCLKAKIGRMELSRFANNECRVWIKEDVINHKAVVVQSFSPQPDQYLVEFCLICDALKKKGARRIFAVIPYFGYSKQDKVFREGEPLSVKVIAQICQTAFFSKLMTLDLHNQAIIGFFDRPVAQLSAFDLFLEHFKKIIDNDFIVVAPDAGSIKSSTSFAGKLGLPVAYIDKERDLSTGEVRIHGISKDIGNKKAIILDDLISTGSTLIETAKYLKKNKAKEIHVAATHHLFVPGAQEKIEKSPIDRLLISDTVKLPEDRNYKKLKVISVAGLVAESIKKNI